MRKAKTGAEQDLRKRYSVFFSVSLAAVLLGMIFLPGCAEEQPEQAQEEEKTTVTYTDCVGRTVDVPKDAEKIAALDSFSGEVMVLLGAGEQMVSCPNGTKSDLILQEIYPGLADITVVQSGGAIHEEELLKLAPDVLLVQDNFYESSEECAKLDIFGIPYLVIKYENMEQQINALRLIGDVAGGKADEKADAIADYYEKTIRQVTAIAETIPENERLTVYHSTNGTYQTDAAGSFGEDWISAVGAIDISAVSGMDLGVNANMVNEEQLYVWNPQVIVAQEKMTADYFAEDKGFSALAAVKNNRVYNLPVGATRWGKEGSAETFFGMLWLGCTIYPDYYKEVDLKQEVTDFYRDYLGITVDDSLYGTILSGEGLRKGSNGGGN